MSPRVRRFLLAVISLVLAAGYYGCGGGGGGGGTSTTTPASVQPPANITADADTDLILNWSSVATVSSFSIYYGTSPGITKTNSTKISDAHSPYEVRDLTIGVTYYAAVASIAADGSESSLSAEVSAKTTLAPLPAAPVSLRAAPGNGQVQISWDPSGASSYTVYYSATPHVTKAASKITNAVSPQAVGPLTNGTQYYFVVSGTNANGEGSISFEISATPVAAPPPVAPTGVTVLEGNGQATLTWNAVAGATVYNIYYAINFDVTKANGTRIASVTSPFVVQPLTNKVGYFFVVTAANGNGESFESATVSATPVAAKPVPAMVSMPAGSFQMGDNFLDAAAPAPYALPVHTVTLSAFSIEKYETTYDQWTAVYNWAVLHGYTFDNVGRNGSNGIGTNMPVTQVDWYDVVKWQNARSEKEGRTPAYYTDATKTVVYKTGQIDLLESAVLWTANGYRLPTEAEWEYASRGGLAGKRYPWGDDLDPSYANYNQGGSTAVGIYPPNGYGLYDIAGDSWEWTWDRDSNDYSADAGGVTNPHGSATGTLRVRRGGSYAYGSRFLRNFDKMFRDPLYIGPYFGFRSASSQP